MSRLDPNSDLASKQILINIQNDQDFLNACATSKTMMDLCKHADVWEERLRLYHPRFSNLIKRTELSPMNLYIWASLLKSAEEEDAGHSAMWNYQKIATILSSLDNIDMEILLDVTPNVPKRYILSYLYSDLIGQGRIDDLVILYKKYTSRDDASFKRFAAKNYPKYGSVELIFQIRPEMHRLVSIYREHVKFYNTAKRGEFLEEFKKRFGRTDDIVLIDIEMGYRDSVIRYPVSREALINCLFYLIPIADWDTSAITAYMCSVHVYPDFTPYLPLTSSVELAIQKLRPNFEDYEDYDEAELLDSAIHEIVAELDRVITVMRRFVSGGMVLPPNLWESIRDGKYYKLLFRAGEGPMSELKAYLN